MCQFQFYFQIKTTDVNLYLFDNTFWQINNLLNTAFKLVPFVAKQHKEISNKRNITVGSFSLVTLKALLSRRI